MVPTEDRKSHWMPSGLLPNRTHSWVSQLKVWPLSSAPPAMPICTSSTEEVVARRITMLLRSGRVRMLCRRRADNQASWSTARTATAKRITANRRWAFKLVCEQLQAGERAITGVMIESNLGEGNQKMPANGDLSSLKRGVSLTDACIDWDTTVKLLQQLNEAVLARRKLSEASS
ncbi:aldolase [Ceraceosorus guamensis]|uniref:3-deoxy-7-phosphoheptulonate synthase n=1 Tax=Ceraceosorus guamensis TaxID=1522189 RepID=A0A316VW56_9BASI|nr:aldolase [Ceraceosorus guamensis]PWN40663.1 aldolase [Ceraceosorus guamensis]